MILHPISKNHQEVRLVLIVVSKLEVIAQRSGSKCKDSSEREHLKELSTQVHAHQLMMSAEAVVRLYEF